ncbi:Uncharacterised protein [Leclercia adecarboxylata]|uniref:Uncharacterized protein n=1 Tax=Leclercia adecarboxylata TaxID=83655 RepID=A0A4U9HDS5_9ENTR|nr:Uncharacterised protein [Leclercia adecarboxylata]
MQSFTPNILKQAEPARGDRFAGINLQTFITLLAHLTIQVWIVFKPA